MNGKGRVIAAALVYMTALAVADVDAAGLLSFRRDDSSKKFRRAASPSRCCPCIV
jgi:hypothetical protein